MTICGVEISRGPTSSKLTIGFRDSPELILLEGAIPPVYNALATLKEPTIAFLPVNAYSLIPIADPMFPNSDPSRQSLAFKKPRYSLREDQCTVRIFQPDSARLKTINCALTKSTGLSSKVP
jgi:hypothetical protein